MLLPGKNICKTCLIITVLISSFLVTSRADDDGSLRLNLGLDFNGGSDGLRDAAFHIEKFDGNTSDEDHKPETAKQGKADDSGKDSGDNRDDSSNNESDNKKEAEPKKSAEISAPKDKADKSESEDESDSDTNRGGRVTKGLVDSKEEKKTAPKVIEADKLDSDVEEGGSRRRRKREAGFLNPTKKRKNKKVGNARKLLFA